MSMKLSGIDQVMNELEKRIGKQAMQAKVDRALVKGAAIFKAELIRQLTPHKDDGHTITEIQVLGPIDYAGKRTVRIQWRGPKGRYRIIHLNEFGTIRNPNPSSKGAIAKAIAIAEKAYLAAVKQELGR